MKKSGWRLALSAVLFACWIGYLAYLAATTTEPIVLSRPQFLTAELYVIAEVPADAADSNQPAKLVKVNKAVWADQPADTELKSIEVDGLRSIKNLTALKDKALAEIDNAIAEAKEAKDRHNLAKKREEVESKFALDKNFVWNGPGEYILPLSHMQNEAKLFTVTPLPRTPGFAGEAGRIYPATPATQRQLEIVTAEYHP